MGRHLVIAAAQMGPIARTESRAAVVRRMIDLMRQAKALGAEVVAYPEATLTAFFPHWFTEDEDEVDAWFERDMPGPQTQALFDEARRLGVGFHLGYCELDMSSGRKRRFNTSILVDASGWQAWGGVAGMIICNDRRWPESYRVLGLQGVDMIFCGYNTPVHHPAAPDHDRLGQFHNELSMQSGAYQNSAWVIGIAKAGMEEGVDMIAGSCIITPTGEIAARCSSAEDEVIVSRCDLDLGRSYRETTFNFARHRRTEHYQMIVERTGPTPP
ncbi:MAG: N-carbamoyl-D-amino-acid hydrolase [Burkholderiales bacterium]|nr:N-carbamoyl-D-amino-acid hydrolase [Burkholderiales bacterium]